MYHDTGKKEIYLINKEYFMAFQFTEQDPFAQMKTGVRSEIIHVRFDDEVFERFQFDKIFGRIEIIGTSFMLLLSNLQFIADLNVNLEELLEPFFLIIIHWDINRSNLKSVDFETLFIDFFESFTLENFLKF